MPPPCPCGNPGFAGSDRPGRTAPGDPDRAAQFPPRSNVVLRIALRRDGQQGEGRRGVVLQVDAGVTLPSIRPVAHDLPGKEAVRELQLVAEVDSRQAVCRVAELEEDRKSVV